MSNVLNIQDYTYDLPHDRIAIYPLPNRDESKLLVYRQGQITSRNVPLTARLPAGRYAALL